WWQQGLSMLQVSPKPLQSLPQIPASHSEVQQGGKSAPQTARSGRQSPVLHTPTSEDVSCTQVKASQQGAALPHSSPTTPRSEVTQMPASRSQVVPLQQSKLLAQDPMSGSQPWQVLSSARSQTSSPQQFCEEQASPSGLQVTPPQVPFRHSPAQHGVLSSQAPPSATQQAPPLHSEPPAVKPQHCSMPLQA